MKEDFSSSVAFQRLRERAEQLLEQGGREATDIEKDDLVRLAHDLEVYQVELELQNEELRSSKAEVEASRAEYFDLYDSSPVAYVTLDEKGIIERANEAAYRMLQLGGKYLSGSQFATLVYMKDISIYFSFIKRLAENHEAGPAELRLRSQDGPVPVLLQGAVKADDTKVKHLRFAIVDITERKRMEEELRMARDELELRVQERTAELEKRARQLAGLSLELTLAEQRERSRVAKLLHDHLQQLLGAARMNQEVLIEKMDDAMKLDAERILDLIGESITATRTLTAELIPPVLNSGDLSASLGWLARWLHENQGFEVKVETEAPIVLDRKDLAVLVFQTIREPLFNVIKHAGVKSAEAKLGYQNGNLQVVISDQGKGFIPERVWEDVESDRKFGLITIRERLLHLGGRFEIESAPNAGSTMSLFFPLDEGRLGEIRAPDFHTETPGKPVPAPFRTQKSGKGIRVMLVDDHPVLLECLSQMFHSQFDIEVVGEASDGEEAVHLARKLVPDVILMDISMPKMNGVEATRIIHAEFPQIRVIGLSMYDEDDQAEAMLNAGASAYLSKRQNMGLLLSAIRGDDQ
jgi:PAS domain S-box-containing protein